MQILKAIERCDRVCGLLLVPERHAFGPDRAPYLRFIIPGTGCFPPIYERAEPSAKFDPAGLNYLRGTIVGGEWVAGCVTAFGGGGRTDLEIFQAAGSLDGWGFIPLTTGE